MGYIGPGVKGKSLMYGSWHAPHFN